MLQRRKVLLADDGSRYARAAAEFLSRRLRRDREVAVHAFTVLPCERSPEGTRDAVELLGRSGFRAKRRHLRGDPAARLLDYAPGYHLLVAGAKGRGAAPFFEVGRVARRLAQEAPIPVLLVRPDPTPPGPQGEAVQMLLAWHESGGGLGASRDALNLLSQDGARISVLRPEKGGVTVWDSTADGSEPVFIRGRTESVVERRTRESGAELLVLPRTPTPFPSQESAADDAHRIGRTLTLAAPCSVLLLSPEESRTPSTGKGLGS